MPINRKLQNIIGTEHITDAAETSIAAQASGGATVAFKNVAVSGQDNIVADLGADTLNIAAGSNITLTTNAGTDTLTIASADTQLSTEAVQDIVGAMFTGNTETNITATYEDSDGTIDLVASAGGGGGLAKGVGVGILNANPFANNSSYQSAYPLWATTTNTNGTGWSGYPSSTELHLIPFQVPVDGDLVELSFRTSGSGWGPVTTYWAIYAAGDDNLPVGAPLFNTSFDISPGTEYEFSVTGVTGKTAGDLLYYAFLGATGSNTINTVTAQIGMMRDGGFALVFPRRISGNNLQNVVGRNYTILKYTGATAGTFPTIAANHAFENTVSMNMMLNVSARYS